jgi:hypothetical protein
MLRRKGCFGLFIFLGFVMVTILYLFVMSGTADVSGTVQLDSKLVSWTENPPGPEDMEMVSANGYCIKGPDADNRMLLSTKNKNKIGKVKYSFLAKEGMQHLIVVYLQMEHLTGVPTQNMELQFMTNIIKKGDLKRDFDITFQEKGDVETIRITVTGEDLDKPMIFEYPMSEIPSIIKL